MPFGSSGSKEKNEKLPSNTHLRDSDHLEEISKITEMLNPNEKVLLVARQSRIKPGGSLHTPNVIYATDRRIIIRDPYMLGIKENVVDIPYDIITSVKAREGATVIHNQIQSSGTYEFKQIRNDGQYD